MIRISSIRNMLRLENQREAAEVHVHLEILEEKKVTEEIDKRSTPHLRAICFSSSLMTLCISNTQKIVGHEIVKSMPCA